MITHPKIGEMMRKSKGGFFLPAMDKEERWKLCSMKNPSYEDLYEALYECELILNQAKIENGKIIIEISDEDNHNSFEFIKENYLKNKGE